MKPCRELLGPDHPNYSDSLNNLANVYIDMGDYEKAYRQLKKVLKIRLDTYGLIHPAVAQAFNHLAVVAGRMQDYEAAEKYHLQALLIRRRTLGELHLQLANSYQNLSYLYAMQNRLEDALQMTEQAERIILAQLSQIFGVTAEGQRIAHI